MSFVSGGQRAEVELSNGRRVRLYRSGDEIWLDILGTYDVEIVNLVDVGDVRNLCGLFTSFEMVLGDGRKMKIELESGDSIELCVQDGTKRMEVHTDREWEGAVVVNLTDEDITRLVCELLKFRFDFRRGRLRDV